MISCCYVGNASKVCVEDYCFVMYARLCHFASTWRQCQSIVDALRWVDQCNSLLSRNSSTVGQITKASSSLKNQMQNLNHLNAAA